MSRELSRVYTRIRLYVVESRVVPLSEMLDTCLWLSTYIVIITNYISVY